MMEVKINDAAERITSQRMDAEKLKEKQSEITVMSLIDIDAFAIDNTKRKGGR